MPRALAHSFSSVREFGLGRPPCFLVPRCVKILAIEHRYKLLMTEKRGGGTKRKVPEDEGEEPPKAASKAKSKPSVTAKAKAAN